MSLRLPRRQYADLFGPTVGDRVRLADTELLIEIERDFTVYGDEALSAGMTTLIGGGTGPATGTNATTCSAGAWNIHRMLEAADGLPINLGFLGKGNASRRDPLREQVAAGAIGLKLHEDWGTTP